MSDDTTTWLKKNPDINPLRRSLKTSLRFHVPNADMDASIISNPDRTKNQELFIPRMLQRPKTQMRMSRAHQFKVPEMVVTKPGKKKDNQGSVVKTKISPALPKKSCLPVPKSKSQPLSRESTKGSLPRPSFLPGGSRKGAEARREIIQKMVELSEIKKKENITNQLSVTSADNSVLRSILKKKRASLRRSMQIAGTKPKAKKVLFDGFQSSDTEEKENVTLSPMEQQIQEERNDFAALDEPTVFLKFPQNPSSNSPQQSCSKEEPSKLETETTVLKVDNVTNFLNFWNCYKEKVSNLQSMQNWLENSIDSLLQNTLTVQKEYDSFKKSSQEIYAKLSRLGEELEENLRKTLKGDVAEECLKPKRRSAGKKLLDKVEKIRLSDKSKAIKKNSGKKSIVPIKNGLIKDMEDSFSIVYKKSFVDN